MRNVGRIVSLRNNIYIKTNFYIVQSRQYFRGRTLNCFLYFRGMLWTYIVLGCVSLLAPTSATYAFLCLALHVAYTVFWSQHLYVVLTTLPVVLSQPMLVGGEPGTANVHLEVSMEYHRADIQERDGEMTGIMGGVRGRGKVQALTAKAIETIKGCRIFSVLCFIACPWFLVYCCASAILCAINGSP